MMISRLSFFFSLLLLLLFCFFWKQGSVEVIKNRQTNKTYSTPKHCTSACTPHETHGGNYFIFRRDDRGGNHRNLPFTGEKNQIQTDFFSFGL